MQIDLGEFTEFGKVKDIWNDCLHDKKGLIEFVKNIVMNDENYNGQNKMLPDLSEIYVLVSKKDFPFHKLTSDQKNTIDLSFANNNFILGYIWLCNWTVESKNHNPYHFINVIDSRISKMNICKYMIQTYEEINESEITLLPFEIDFGARYYWKKYFNKEFEIANKDELNQMIIDWELSEEVRWEELFTIFK